MRSGAKQSGLEVTSSSRTQGSQWCRCLHKMRLVCVVCVVCVCVCRVCVCVLCVVWCVVCRIALLGSARLNLTIGIDLIDHILQLGLGRVLTQRAHHSAQF